MEEEKDKDTCHRSTTYRRKRKSDKLALEMLSAKRKQHSHIKEVCGSQPTSVQETPSTSELDPDILPTQHVQQFQEWNDTLSHIASGNPIDSTMTSVNIVIQQVGEIQHLIPDGASGNDRLNAVSNVTSSVTQTQQCESNTQAQNQQLPEDSGEDGDDDNEEDFDGDPVRFRLLGAGDGDEEVATDSDDDSDVGSCGDTVRFRLEEDEGDNGRDGEQGNRIEVGAVGEDVEDEDPDDPGYPHDPDDPGYPHDPDDPGYPHDPDDPGYPHDPDDPGNPFDEENEDDEDEDDDNAAQNFNLLHRSLAFLCLSVNPHSVKECLALVLALAARHNQTYETTIHMFTIINVMLGRTYLPSSKKLLWQVLGRNYLGMRKIAYCPRCYSNLGPFNRLLIETRCACGALWNRKKIPYFIILSLKRQLLNFLRRRGTAMLMYSKQNRVKMNPEALEDIYDGRAYQRLAELESEHNFSYTFNTDGFRITKTSSIQAWPILVRLNDLPLHVRQKHIFLAGLWVGKGDPNMNLFFRGFVQQANELSETGIEWSPDGVRQIQSKFIPTCCPVDSKARCLVLNMAPPTGYYSCNVCTHRGVHAAGVKFPVLPHPDVQAPVRRTDAQIKEIMGGGAPQQGIYGPAAIMNMNHLDLGTSLPPDDLHPIFEGVVKFHMSLLLDFPNEPYYIGHPAKISLINGRLNAIKHPTIISRNTRGIDLRSMWRGNEWRNWLLYHAIPCLQGIVVQQRHLTHLEMLSRAVFLLSSSSITEENLNEAERLLNNYVALFQEYFGVENMRYNLHMLTHLVDAVRNWGPLFVQSTFGFESWNMRIRKKVKSPNDPINQVVTRHLIDSFMNSIEGDEDISEEVKQKCDEILHGEERKNVLNVNNVHLIGTGDPRLPTDEELQLLHDNDIAFDHFMAFKRARYGRLEIRSTAYEVESRIDNSNVYTVDDTFGSVQSILKVENEGNVQCFCVLSLYNTDQPLPIARHIVRIGEERRNVYDLCPFENIGAFAVKVYSRGVTYIMPMPNSSEID